MAPVNAIGGVFFRALDPAALASWYARAFGLPFDDGGTYAVLPAVGDASAVLAIFPAESGYLGDPRRQQAMVNLRTDDLGELLARLDHEGIAHEEARRMLIAAFVREVIDRVGSAPLREHLLARLARRLAMLEK